MSVVSIAVANAYTGFNSNNGTNRCRKFMHKYTGTNLTYNLTHTSQDKKRRSCFMLLLEPACTPSITPFPLAYSSSLFVTIGCFANFS
jgi:hypothetical protein